MKFCLCMFECMAVSPGPGSDRDSAVEFSWLQCAAGARSLKPNGPPTGSQGPDPTSAIRLTCRDGEMN